MKLLAWACIFLSCALGVFSAILKNPIPCLPTPNAITACVIGRIEWFSQTSAIVNTGDGKMWRTTDEGRTYTQIGKNMDYIEQHPTNPLVMIFLYTSNTTFTYTTDGGATLTNGTLPVGRLEVTRGINFHPTEIGKLMFVGCFNTKANKCSLYSTNTAWGVGKDGWKKSFGSEISNLVPTPAVYGNTTAEKDIVFIVKQDESYGYTTDYSKFHEIFKNTLLMYKSRHYMWVVVVESKKNKLYSSSAVHDPSHKSKSSYKVATFEYSNTLNEDDYTFLDDTTTAEYMAIHMSTFGSYGDVYTSNAGGVDFELTLSRVYRQNYYYDFHRIRGLEGVYIANTYDYITLETQALRTFVTFDNGGEWRQLRPPATDRNGNPWPCGAFTPTCALHIHGEGSSIAGLGVPSLRTHSNAIGVIIANGNVGSSLSSSLAELKTFISRDAGLTWTHVFDQASNFEFGDHGGIITLAPFNALTTSLYYSFDQTNFQLATNGFSTQLTVSSITTEPQGTGLNFIVQGSYNGAFYLYTFDLSDANLPLCGDNDYENWTPSDGYSEVGCLMGLTTTYLRRKATSICYNNRTTDVVLSQTPCACTFEDYECASNYLSSERGTNGAFTCTKQSEDPKCTPGEKYYEPTGYQLVPATSCDPTATNAVKLLGKQKTCSSSHAGVIVAVILVLLVVGAAGTVVALYFKNDKFRDMIDSFRNRGNQDQSYRGLTNDHDDDDDNTV